MNTFLSGDVKVDLTITQPTFATKQSWRGILPAAISKDVIVFNMSVR